MNKKNKNHITKEAPLLFSCSVFEDLNGFLEDVSQNVCREPDVDGGCVLF